MSKDVKTESLVNIGFRSRMPPVLHYYNMKSDTRIFLRTSGCLSTPLATPNRAELC